MNQYHRTAKIITDVVLHEVPQLHHTELNLYDLSKMVMLPDGTVIPEQYAQHKIVKVHNISHHLNGITKDLYIAWSPKVEEAIGVPLSLMNELQSKNNLLTQQNENLQARIECATNASFITRLRFLFLGKLI